MFKFLLILFLILYVIYKIGGMFFKAGAAYQQFRGPRQQQQQQRPEGSIHVDSVPKKEKRKGSINGGEYVDYEEVK